MSACVTSSMILRDLAVVHAFYRENFYSDDREVSQSMTELTSSLSHLPPSRASEPDLEVKSHPAVQDTHLAY